ncbi:RNA polymerase sigma factor [Cellulomonas edaphi]|uniref:Sigma-70 family RNA polymerase sigma factor n=1 Tax=Cellulomonas edaphi TaxID=3053468 RepID=A0ABT7S526_9CELL|nr:sigma-70 family RNA polymerase sigma factor [Cellulomons edaphi]MDM7830619.1 sigma-70 family RNA polymerase sigma factor [Cellulomons edaphi]
MAIRPGGGVVLDALAPGHAEAAASFEALFREVAPRVRRYVARTVGDDAADDVVSETFTTAWRRWAELPEDHGMRRAWIYRTAHYECAHALRSRSRRQHTAERAAARRELGDDPTDRVVGDDRVARVLAALPDTDRDALELVVWHALTPAEAAYALGCSPTAMRARLSRARRRLAAVLGEGDLREVGS